MKKSLKPKFSDDALGKNIFLEGCVYCEDDTLIDNEPVRVFEIEVVRVEYQNRLIRNTKGELRPMNSELEHNPYTKHYWSKGNCEDVMSLSPKACKLLLWVSCRVDPGSDHIWVNKDSFMSKGKMSLNTFKEAIKELIDNNFLSETNVKEVYWINPKYFFKGDRISKYPKNVKIKHSYQSLQ